MGRVKVENSNPVVLDTKMRDWIFTEDTTLRGIDGNVEFLGWGFTDYHKVTIDGNWITSTTSGTIREYDVKGDWIIDEGVLDIKENCKVNVEGNLKIQRRNGAQTDGALRIWNNGEVTVKGDFIANTTYYRSTSTSYSLFYSAANARLNLHGNFKTDSGTFQNRYGDNARIVFAGSGEQHAAIAEGSYMGRVSVTNPNPVILDTIMCNWIFTEDTTLRGLDGDVEFHGWGFTDYHKVTIDGNWITSTNSGTIREYDVKGDWIIDEGVLDIKENCKVNVEGDLKIQKRDGSQADGALRIWNDGEVTVKGNFIAHTTYYRSTSTSYNLFYTAAEAKLILHGDFRAERGTFQNRYGNDARIVFAGTEEQHFSMDENGYLGRVSIENPKGLNVETPIRGIIFTDENTLLKGEINLLEYDFNNFYSYYKVKIDGDWIVERNIGTIREYEVTGDLIIENGVLEIEDYSPTVPVQGSITIGGNVYIQKKDIDGSFRESTGGLRIIKGAVVTVDKSFTSETSHYNGVNSSNSLFGSSTGTLKVNGYFNIRGGDFCSTFGNGLIEVKKGISCSDSDSVVRFGKVAASSASKTLSINNSSGAGSNINVQEFTAGGTLRITNNVKINNFHANGNMVTFEESSSIGYLNIGSGTVHCNSSITIDGNGLNITDGYFYAQKGLTVLNNARITMTDSSGIIIVDSTLRYNSTANTLIDSGTVQLNGNVNLNTDATFKTNNGATAKLFGREQVLTFLYDSNSTNLYFANLTVDKDISNYTFSKTPCWGNLVQANNEMLDYWWDTQTNTARYWRTTPYLYYTNHSINYDFSSVIHTGINQWDNHVSITPAIRTSNLAFANIEVYSGTQEELVSQGAILESQIDPVAGAQTLPKIHESESINLLFAGRTITIERYYHAKIVLYDDLIANAAREKNGDPISYYQHSFTHELGHALGWTGHSNIDGDLMYHKMRNNNNITFRDSSHIQQIYDLYR